MTKKAIIEKAESIQGWMNHTELEGLYFLAQAYLKQGDEAVEVGSWKGRSSYVLASVCEERGARLICIDTFEGSEMIELDYTEGRDMGAKAFVQAYILKNLKGLPVDYMLQDSKTAHRFIKNSSVALCFIDGDHKAPGVFWDVKNYWPKVKKGGVFCGHDYNAGQPDVTLAVQSKFPHFDENHLFGSIWYREK